MPAIATSVEVVVAIASAMSPIIGGRAFTGNGRRFVPSGRRGAGCAHCVSLFNDLSSSFHLIFYRCASIMVAVNKKYVVPLSDVFLS